MKRPAECFAAETALGGAAAAQARKEISLATLRHDPALKATVRADCEALAKAGAQECGFADLSDLTCAGYSQDFALHMTEIIAAAGRKAGATRDFGQGGSADVQSILLARPDQAFNRTEHWAWTEIAAHMAQARRLLEIPAASGQARNRPPQGATGQAGSQAER